MLIHTNYSIGYSCIETKTHRRQYIHISHFSNKTTKKMEISASENIFPAIDIAISNLASKENSRLITPIESIARHFEFYSQISYGYAASMGFIHTDWTLAMMKSYSYNFNIQMLEYIKSQDNMTLRFIENFPDIAAPTICRNDLADVYYSELLHARSLYTAYRDAHDYYQSMSGSA